MKTKLLLFILTNIWLVFSSVTISQNIFLYGTVIDKDSKKPIQNVNIYLANTQIGSTTNKFGYFELHHLPQGTFSVIFSHVSYGFTTKKVNLIRKFNDLGVTKLSLKIYQLETVLVKGDNANIWKKQFQIFKDNFIGTWKNADSTFIQNPYNIDFRENDDKLYASSTEPIEIINKSLGYKIIYFLNYFEACDEYTKYSGNAVFFPLPHASKVDSLRWTKNRRETYAGSLRHFLDVLNSGYSKFVFDHKSYRLTDGYSVDTRYSKCDSLLNSKGFFIYHVDDLPWIAFTPSSEIPISTKKLLSKGEINTERYLKFSNFLRVYYTPNYGGDEYPANYRIRNIPTTQGSYLELTKDSVMVDIHGRYFDNFGIHTFGKFGQERISDLLPYEYIKK